VNVNLGIWDKLTKLAVLLLFILGVVGVAIWYLPLIKQNERMRQQLLQSETKVKAEEARYRDLRIATEAARSNPKTVERTAREKLGYAKPGETVIRFEEPATRR
jgi:cell division protein FtsB